MTRDQIPTSLVVPDAVAAIAVPGSFWLSHKP
jgi:hypothetical protein